MRQLRVKIEKGLDAAWAKVLEERHISQQDAVIETIKWLTRQSPLVQMIVFGQAPKEAHADLWKLAAKYAAEEAKRK